VKLSIEYKQPRAEVTFSAPSLGLSTGIPVARDLVDRPAYEGPYSVTPTEEAQTLETDGKRMTDNVTVGAIPSDYVGSAVPRRTKNDINITKIVMPGGVQTPVAIAAKGYYQSTTTKNIPTGTATTPDTSITANPTVSVDSNGLVAASVSESQSVTPTVNEGYVMSGTDGTVSVQGSNTLQLNTQAAETITPTESEQTAVAAQKFTTGEVKVAAIPNSYIGSAVPQRSSSDLTVSGATVTVPVGHYAEAASKAVPSGSASTPNTSIPVDVDVSLSATGLITATAIGSQSITPNVVEGYVDRGTAGTVSFDGSKMVQLSTQAGTTITPTESEQTAVASGKYTTGEVKVGAISSSYVGSGVTRNDSTDLSVSGATVTAPAGYYENSASADVASATWKDSSTVGVVPSITVSSGGLISVDCAGWTSCKPLSTAGYTADVDTAANIQLVGTRTSQLDTQAAQTITPTTEDQTIRTGKYLTGEQTVKGDPYLLPGNIKSGVTIFNTVGTYVGGTGSNLIARTITENGTYNASDEGADGFSSIVANVNLVHVGTLPTKTYKLSDTAYNTWTPSTTAKVVLVTQEAGTFTATDITNHEYFVRIRGYIDVQYISGTTNGKGLFKFCCFENWNAITRRASNAANLNSGTMNANISEAITTSYLNKYYNGGWVAIYTSANGFYPTNTAQTISSTSATSPTITVKTPAINAKCNATYFATSYASKVDKEASTIKFVFDIYRADVGYLRKTVNTSLANMWLNGLTV